MNITTIARTADDEFIVTDDILQTLSTVERNYLLDNNNGLFTLRDLTVEEEAELSRLISSTMNWNEAL